MKTKSNMTVNQKPKELDCWEKKLDKKWEEFVNVGGKRPIKEFIQSLLTQQRTEIIKEIERLKRVPQFEPVKTALAVIYNEAITDVIKILVKK